MTPDERLAERILEALRNATTWEDRVRAIVEVLRGVEYLLVDERQP